MFCGSGPDPEKTMNRIRDPRSGIRTGSVDPEYFGQNSGIRIRTDPPDPSGSFFVMGGPDPKDPAFFRILEDGQDPKDPAFLKVS